MASVSRAVVVVVVVVVVSEACGLDFLFLAPRRRVSVQGMPVLRGVALRQLVAFVSRIFTCSSLGSCRANLVVVLL